jgi:hypothetical protein
LFISLSIHGIESLKSAPEGGERTNEAGNNNANEDV